MGAQEVVVGVSVGAQEVIWVGAVLWVQAWVRQPELAVGRVGASLGALLGLDLDREAGVVGASLELVVREVLQCAALVRAGCGQSEEPVV